MPGITINISIKLLRENLYDETIVNKKNESAYNLLSISLIGFMPFLRWMNTLYTVIY